MQYTTNSIENTNHIHKIYVSYPFLPPISITLNVSIILVKYISAKPNIPKCNKRSSKNKHTDRTL